MDIAAFSFDLSHMDLGNFDPVGPDSAVDSSSPSSGAGVTQM
jgi:hypothetical protein